MQQIFGAGKMPTRHGSLVSTAQGSAVVGYDLYMGTGIWFILALALNIEEINWESAGQ